MALTAQVALSILAHETSSGDLSRTLRATPANYALTLTDGTGANQAQVVWSDSRTLAGSSEALNVKALEDTRDGAAVTVSFSAIKLAYIRNSSANQILLYGLPIGLTVGAVLALKAGGALLQVAPTAEGLVTETGTQTITVAADAGTTYDIVLIGEGTVT